MFRESKKAETDSFVVINLFVKKVGKIEEEMKNNLKIDPKRKKIKTIFVKLKK